MAPMQVDLSSLKKNKNHDSLNSVSFPASRFDTNACMIQDTAFYYRSRFSN